MRVLHVIPSIAPRYGGPSYAVVRYCRALRQHGVRVTVATTNADGAGVLDVPTDEATEYEGVDARFFARRGETFKYSPSLGRWLRNSVSDFDVVHVHAVFSHASLSAGRACRIAGVPYIVRPLGSLDRSSLTQQAWRKRVLMWSAAGSLLRNAAGLHFTTEGERELATAVVGEFPARVIPLGVDDQYLASRVSAAEGVRRVVVLARLDRTKNLGSLIRAFHAAGDAAAWRLTIAGAGDVEYAGELQRAAEDGPAASRIDFRPWLDGQEKLDLMRSASVFAVPSFQENFGLGALEAMACGVPVMAARGVNLAPAIAQADAGWIMGTDDEDVAATLREVMRDEVGRRRRAANARKLAANYTWDSAAAQLEAWYSALTPRLPVDDAGLSNSRR
jgi:glycosyltransferase involved in cell wall biosynthesis